MATRILHGLLLGALLAVAGTSTAAAQRVVIGSTNFAEQLLLANMYAEVLEAHDVDVRKRLNLGSREIVFPALQEGEIDLLPEYSGALLAYVAGGDHEATSEADVLTALRELLPQGMEILAPASAQNRDTLVVRAETAETYGLARFSDLAAVAGELVVGGPPEMETRHTGLPGLREVYGIEFANFRPLDAGGPVTTGALENGDIDVARMFSTQGVIAQRGWISLVDDRSLSPAQNLVPLARSEVVTETVRDALAEISERLTTDELQRLNRQIDVDGQEPEDVAREWVRAQGLID